MADGYLSMLQLCGMAMMVAIRAALIPSSPRRTILVTALFGVPMILVTAVLVPAAGGGLALARARLGRLSLAAGKPRR